MPTFSSATSLYEDFVNPEETVFDENAISNALHNILNTRIGSMPGRPTFGSRIYEVPFEPNDDSTKGKENSNKEYIYSNIKRKYISCFD